MERAQTPEQFAESASKLMERARDPHLWIKVGEKSIGGFKRNAVRNYNISTLRRIVPGFVERNKRVSTGRFEDGIGYILINNWSKDGDNLEPAFAALKEFSDAPGLIIDVRPNSGGSEPLAEEFAGCFVDKPVMYSKHIYRKADEPNGFSQPQERILQPNKKQVRYKGKVTVLMGQANMSSCESFLLMMKQAGCKLVGERSYGSSGNPKPYELGNGVTVWLPSWKDLLPDGTCLEGRGVLPDIGVSTTDAQLKNGDPVLDAGLKYLRGR
jgi:C-terminal processing protease CtpA/Prc